MTTLKFEKEDFILPTAFPWIKEVLLNNMHAPNNLQKKVFESMRTILEKADKVPTTDFINASHQYSNRKS